MKYTLYNATGKIVSVRDCPDITEQVLDDNILWIEGEYPSSNYYIDDGAPVEFPTHSFKYANFDYLTKTWVEDIKRIENEVKTTRNVFLSASDWTDTLSAKNRLGDDLYNQWQTYRQALRDITTQPGYPTEVVWPTKP